jgi:hypothetical protein
MLGCTVITCDVMPVVPCCAVLWCLQIGRALLEAVSLSVAAELQRRMDAAAAAAAADGDAADQGSEAGRCADVCRTANALVSEEHMWTK